EHLQWSIPGDLHERVGVGDGVGGERRLSEEVTVDRFPAARVGAGARLLTLESLPRDQRFGRAQAVAGLAVEAVPTLSAGWPHDDDLVAGGHLRHPFADPVYDTGAFMP